MGCSPTHGAAKVLASALQLANAAKLEAEAAAVPLGAMWAARRARAAAAEVR